MMSAVAFQEGFLKRKLWAKQKELCRAVISSEKDISSIIGCHGSGKTFTLAGLVPYFLLAHDDSIVLTIAPTFRQVKLMWAEIAAAIQSMPIRNPPEITTTAWKLSEKNYAQGFSAARGVNAQGFHGANVLIIEDEAVGIQQDVFDAIDGIRSSGTVREVRSCNPTVAGGTPFEDFTKHRASRELIKISAFDTPNLEGLTLESLLQLPEDQLDIMPFPTLTRRRWVKEMYYKWGPNNPRFQSRVLGEFPTQNSNAVFNLAWIEEAGLPYEDEDFRKDLGLYAQRLFIQIGLDIAGPGDDETVMYARIGTYIVAFEAWSKADPLDEVLLFLGRLQQRFPQIPIVIMADVVGIGYHFARAVARHAFDVREFRAGGSPVDPVMFANAKAETYWRLREHMQAKGINGVLDEDTKAQLADIRYRELLNGKIEIEHKDEARARGSSSPDRAEALVMAFARIVPKEQTISFSDKNYQISSY